MGATLHTVGGRELRKVHSATVQGMDGPMDLHS